MASSKSFFGLRRGSTKTLTFSVFNGKQVTKDRVESVKNPRSLAQMQQRMVMATASAAYASMKEIVDHSFEGFPYGLNNMSEFIRQNAKAIKDSALNPKSSQFAFNPYQNRNLYGGAFIMSAGSANPINEVNAHAYVSLSDKVTVMFGGEQDGLVPSADWILASLRISVGEMCTVCFIAEDNRDATGVFGYVRLKAKASGTTQLTTENFSTYFDVESNKPLVLSTIANGHLYFSATVQGVVENSAVADCAIHSAKSNNGWLRSNTVMKLNGFTLAPGYDDAIATYPVGESYVLNGGKIG